jgi:hypothetical protein
VLLQILSGAQNASNLLPVGSVYGLSPNKSVEISIANGAIGGPVSIRVYQSLECYCSNDICHISSTPFTCMGTLSMWSMVLGIRPTTLLTPYSQCCEYWQRWRQHYDPLLHRQTWPVVPPLPHQLALPIRYSGTQTSMASTCPRMLSSSCTGGHRRRLQRRSAQTWASGHINDCCDSGQRKTPFYKVMQGMPTGIAVDAFCYGVIPSVTSFTPPKLTVFAEHSNGCPPSPCTGITPHSGPSLLATRL